MTASLIGQRTPVAIDDGLLRAGTQTVSFDCEQPETLLRNYLRLIRRTRSQQRVPEISLRREDVEALADYLGVTAESVLHRLATLMGSSRTQRTTMLAAFASGALLIALAGSAAATSPGLDAGAPFLAGQSVEWTATEEGSTAEVPTELDITTRSAIAEGTIFGNAAQAADGSAIEVDEASAELPRGSASLLADSGTFTPAFPAPSTPAPSTRAPSVVAAANGRPAAPDLPVGSDTDVDDLVALVAPVVPDLADVVAVGVAVVPPTGAASPDPVGPGADSVGAVEEVVQPPTATTIAPADEIPQELPPVDDDTVAVGPAPVPPTVPAPAPTSTTAP